MSNTASLKVIEANATVQKSLRSHGSRRERTRNLPATMPQTQILLRHIGLKPNQYSPLSKLKLACTIGDVEAVTTLLLLCDDPLATGAIGDWHHGIPAIHAWQARSRAARATSARAASTTSIAAWMTMTRSSSRWRAATFTGSMMRTSASMPRIGTTVPSSRTATPSRPIRARRATTTTRTGRSSKQQPA